MQTLRGTTWGPQPLPELLRRQLDAHGFAPTDAAECARQISDCPGPAALASLFVDLGACKFLEGDIDGAVASWRHALTGDHDAAAARALLNLGLLYEHLHLHEHAVAVFDSVAERSIAPYQSSAVMASARCHQAAGDSDLAMETMARLAQSEMARGSGSETFAETLYGLGEIAAEAGRFDRAERAWRAASAGAPSAPQQAAAERLMTLLLDQGHDEEMLDLLEDQPDDAASMPGPAVIERVEALHRLGSDEQAAALAVTIDGEKLAAGDRFRLADVRRQVGLINEAIDELEALLADADLDVQQRAAFSLGEIYRNHSMHDAAVVMYERALRQADDFWAPKAALALGDVWSDEGDREKALEHWTYATSSPVATVSDVANQRLEATFDEPAIAPVDEPARAEADQLAQPQLVRLAEVAEPDHDIAEPQVVVLADIEDEVVAVDEVVVGAEQDEPVDEVRVDEAGARDEPVDEVVVEAEQAGARGELVVAVDEVVVGAEQDEPVDEVVLEAEQAAARDDLVVAVDEVVVDEAGARDDLVVAVDEVVVDEVVAVEAQRDEFVDGEFGAHSQEDELAEPQVVLPSALGGDDASAAAGPTPVEPQVIVLASLEESQESTEADEAPTVAPATSDAPLAATTFAPTTSVFRTLSDPNPYAALAPEQFENDVAPSSRNPYAELAPNFDDESPLSSDVEPGDWESILDDWPRDDDPPTPAPKQAAPRGKKAPAKKKSSSAFSKYT